MTATRSESLAGRVFAEYAGAFFPFLLPLGYLVGVVVGVRENQLPWALALGAGHVLAFGCLWPWVVVKRHLAGFEALPGDAKADRLSRLLAMPRRIELDGSSGIVVGTVVYIVAGSALWGWSLKAIFPTVLVAAALNMLAGVRFWLAAEKLLRAEGIAEFHRHPDTKPSAWWGHWPRLSWYLPFTFLSILIGTASILSVYLYARLAPAVEATRAELVAAGDLAAAAIVSARAEVVGVQLAMPLLVLCVFMLAFSWLTAAQLAKRYEQGSREVQSAVEAFAAGAPRLPNWIGTDEFGDLAMGLAGVFGRLSQHAATLRTSAAELLEAAVKLGVSTTDQHEMMSRHAAALRETEVTAQEIRQTALIASAKTESVLGASEHAVELGRLGETAIAQSISGLSGIRDEVGEMSDQIRQLGERARQIAGITSTVKDLADQSNMLALNAAIEAVRSGEHGKGFGVVAREIRTLADQSIQATAQVREILEDISAAIHKTVELSERGSSRVQRSLVQVESSGTSLRQVSGIVSENAASVREIATAVSQQGAGVSQIFAAVQDLSRVMDTTVQQLQQTDDTLAVVRRVADRVDLAVKGFVGEVPSEPKVRPAA
jgi:methyl-accepting chemotaxis protein